VRGGAILGWIPEVKLMRKVNWAVIGPSLLLATALLFALALRTGARQTAQSKKSADAASHGLQFSGEKHLANIRQLTFGGQSAEAYFSADGTRLIFQSLVISRSIVRLACCASAY